MTTHPTYAALRERFQQSTLEQRRWMLIDGAAFASFSIMTPIETAERTFQRWREQGRVSSMQGISKQLRNQRERRLLSVASLPMTTIMVISTAGSPMAERVFAQETVGYGPAKSSFALALAGIGTMGCIDSRLIRKHHLSVRELETFDGYIEVLNRLYPGVEDTASAQAYEWLADLRRDRFDTAHELLLGASPQMTLAL